MIDLELSWRQAGVAATGLIVASVALRATRKPRLAAIAVFTQESGLILGLFALWQLAGSLAGVSPDGALARSRWIWHFERVVHLPSETSMQKVILHHPLVVQFFNLYYDSLHFPVLVATLIWLFVRHRDRYKRLRTTLVGLTGSCLLVQLIPVAPPRMLPETHLVDTAIKYHQSVYGNTAGFDPDQLSAMPSVHVGWAVLVAVAVISTLRSRWRWLAVLYPVMTTLAVIVTANHFWLDGIVAGLILVLVLAVQTGARTLYERLRAPRVVPAAEPEPTDGVLPEALGRGGSVASGNQPLTR
jgi:PAP2 superfamily